ncbi:MAG: HK97-gp10 family putative phage morphogenesis protein [Verrucomicrobiota bacterium]
MSTSNVIGFQQLQLRIRALENKIQRGAMREALTKAARPVTAAAKRNAPKGLTGLLKKSIRQKISTNTRKGSVTAIIGPSKNTSGQYDLHGTGEIVTVRPHKYAHLVEFGTASRGAYHKGVKVTPGNAPNPFMRSAWEASRAAAAARFKVEMIPAIQRAAARVRASIR